MLSLFPPRQEINANLLPYDGSVNYWGSIYQPSEADRYFQNLLHEIAWQHDEIWLFGKKITTKRKVGWYGSLPFSYTYSGSKKEALPWTADLMEIKKTIETLTGASFNSCLLNLYHNGSEGMAWHSDDEKELKPQGAIASMSFGAARKFVLKHNRTNFKVNVLLEPGSLLMMEGETQMHWKHSLPVSKRIFEPRINLTFRTIQHTR